ncbi:unnamed protein product [Sphagnum balticum]
MSAKRTTSFQLSHCLEYGLTIRGCDVKKAVSCVQCNFCIYGGRSGDDIGRKHMRIESICLFTPPYHLKLYRKHLKKQHAEGWLECQGLSKAKKQMFFDRQKKATINRFFCTANDVLEMTIASKIVSELIRDLYFHLDDDVVDGDNQPISKVNAMKLFQLDEGGATYSVTIKNPLRFWLVIDHTSSDLSFRSCPNHVSSHSPLRVTVPPTTNLLLRHSHQSGCYGVLHNLHLVIVSFYGRHTAVNILALIVKILDVLFPMWRDKLISVSSDGENTMTSRHGGFVTLLEKEATNNIMRVWCVLHQMDIVIKKVMKAMMDGLFYKIAHVFSVHMCAQLNLIMEMDGAKCPKDTTQWVAFGKMLKWFLHHRHQLL